MASNKQDAGIGRGSLNINGDFQSMMGMFGFPRFTTEAGIPDSPNAPSPDNFGAQNYGGGLLGAAVPQEMRAQYGNYFATNRPQENLGLLNKLNVPSEVINQAQAEKTTQMPQGRTRTDAIRFAMSKGYDVTSPQFKAWLDANLPEQKKYEPKTMEEALEFERKKNAMKASDLSFGDKELIKKTVLEMPKLKKEAVSGQTSLTQIDKALQFMSGDVTGKGGQLKAWLAPYAEMFGIQNKSLTDAQSFQLLTRAIIGPMRLEIVGPGPVSEWEQQLMQKISGGGGATKEAAQELLGHWKKLAQGKIDNYNDTLEGFSGVYPNMQSTYKPIGRGMTTGQEGAKTVTKRGTDKATGKRVVQYSDGSMEYE